MALILLDVGPGDEVWTATLTFVATANAIRYVGATPVFIDSERESWNMDPALLREALRDAATRGVLPKALVVVDLYGQCADYDSIQAACRSTGSPVIEDAAEALGATYRGKPAGSFGTIGVLSFNGNKIMTTSGGGALLCDDVALVERARHLASQARQPVAHYEHSEIGYNYRLSNLLAAVGRAQLSRLDGFVERRREINRTYRAALAGIDGITFLPEAPGGRSTCWLTCVLLDKERLGVGPEQIREHLETHNIEARPVWKPMHLQPVYRGCRVVGGEVAADLFARGLCLPSGSTLSDEAQQLVIEALPRNTGPATRRDLIGENLSKQRVVPLRARAQRKMLLGDKSGPHEDVRLRNSLRDKMRRHARSSHSKGRRALRRCQPCSPNPSPPSSRRG